MSSISINVSSLLKDNGLTPMDLIRYGMAQNTAYKLSKNRVQRIDLDTLQLLCDFFSDRLGRPVTPNDIIQYTPKTRA